MERYFKILNNFLLARLSQRVWTTTPRRTVNQEIKTLNYAYYTELIRVVKIIRSRNPEALA